ncbi:beta-lactamase [Aliidongia dinghuensis]|uniref:Beta-lactamase n=1 Tax=Aliidongia dinghuensis TaxID=1867774 RepID=A0A8J2YVJ0_9PROT|nr:class A beta-lactamase [Aliidongia dinghuensis]GGF27940.1 beta-lactamase [Aliidongia dinghuensis]
MIDRRQFLVMSGAMVGGSALGLTLARAGSGFDGLERAFAQIEAAHGGRLGVAVLDTGSDRRAGYRQDERFPLCSTFKLLAAGAILARVEAGKDSLERRIRFSAADVVAYSPVTKSRTGGDGLMLATLCEAAITQSDNTAGNLLLRTLDGPAGLTAYLRSLGDTVTRLDRWETSLNEAQPGDPRDTTTPAAMLADVQALTLGAALKTAGKAQLLEWLRGNRTGDRRLRAKLPDGWVAAEKTGTGDHGTSNDVGLLFPPNGAAPLLVAAYFTEGPADSTVRDGTLAEVGASVVTAWLS